MTQRQEEIMKTSISFFNENGVSNVKLTDITVALGISLGNLTYYYKTKKDLIAGILMFMSGEKSKLHSNSEQLLGKDNWTELLRNYLLFQVRFSFFYRDILSLTRFSDQAKLHYETEVNLVITFIRNANYMAIGKGYLRPEAREGLYDGIAENGWSIMQAWFIKRAVFGIDKIVLDEPVRSILDLYYPYATEKGLEALALLRSQKKIIQVQ